MKSKTSTAVVFRTLRTDARSLSVISLIVTNSVDGSPSQ